MLDKLQCFRHLSSFAAPFEAPVRLAPADDFARQQLPEGLQGQVLSFHALDLDQELIGQD